MSGFVPKVTTSNVQERMDQLREIISADIGEPVVLEFDVIPVEFIQFRSEPAKLRKAPIKAGEAGN